MYSWHYYLILIVLILAGGAIGFWLAEPKPKPFSKLKNAIWIVCAAVPLMIAFFLKRGEIRNYLSIFALCGIMMGARIKFNKTKPKKANEDKSEEM